MQTNSCPVECGTCVSVVPLREASRVYAAAAVFFHNLLFKTVFLITSYPMYLPTAPPQLIHSLKQGFPTLALAYAPAFTTTPLSCACVLVELGVFLGGK